MSLKSHQGSPDTHTLRATEPHNVRGKSSKISSIFLLTALYAKLRAHFQWHLYKCGAPFSHPYPHCGKSDLNGVFKLLQKQKPDTPNMFLSRAESWCYSIKHLIPLGNNGPEPSPQHCIGPRARAFQVLNTGIWHKKNSNFWLLNYKLHHYACARWKERTNLGHPGNFDAGVSSPPSVWLCSFNNILVMKGFCLIYI